MTTLGFVGLGRMGRPMVRHLLADGHSVSGFDLDPDAVNAVVEYGATASPDLESLATTADVIMLSLPGPAEVEAVVDELADGLAGGEVIIDHTTSKPGTTATVAARLEEMSVTLLGAPVSGGRSGAVAGTLSVMVGGDRSAADGITPIVEAFADNVFHVSDRPEHAHALKLLNNYLSITGVLATSEAVLVGQQIGLDIGTMVDVFTASTGRNSSTDDKFPNQVVTGAFDTGFAMELVEKDIDLFAAFADETDTSVLLGDVVRNLIGYAHAELGDDADMTEIYRYMESVSAPDTD